MDRRRMGPQGASRATRQCGGFGPDLCQNIQVGVVGSQNPFPGGKIKVMRSLREMRLGHASGEGVSGGNNARGTHAWIRWAKVWDGLFYVLLVGALASSLADMGLNGRTQLVMGALTVLFGLWYWFMIIRHRRWIQNDVPMLVYAAGAIALCIALIWINPVYYWVLSI